MITIFSDLSHELYLQGVIQPEVPFEEEVFKCEYYKLSIVIMKASLKS